ncbi:MAG: Uma2 family endonuclease [Pseudomonadota bacterium]|nr:Uma2 family endonuclease [Pseudomonadota bacterium]
MGFTLHKDERYTVEQYLTWPEDGPRYELLEGIPYELNAPSVEHQQLVGGLHYELEHYQRERIKQGGGGHTPCIIVESPVDVILSDITVVQPDLIVVCNPAIIVNGRVRGAPDLVVEVLSPSTAVRDKKQKLRLYEVAGVPQYLVIDPTYRCAELYIRGADGRYPVPEVLDAGDVLTLQVAPDFSLTLSDIFGWPLPLAVQENQVAYG